MRRSLFLAFTIFFLYGCAASVQTADSIGQSAEKAALQQDLLEPCAPLPKKKKKEYNQQESFDIMKLWASMYYNCSKKHQALVDLLEYDSLKDK